MREVISELGENMEYKGLDFYFEYKGANIIRTNNFESLPSATQQTLLPQLVEAAAAGFCRPVTKEFAEDVFQHIKSGDLFIIMSSTQALGLAIRSYHPEVKAVFLAGATKSPYAPTGIVEELSRRYINEKGAQIVATRTQNDRVVEVMVSLCNEVVPVHRKVSVDDLNTLNKLGQITSTLDMKRLVIDGCYGGSMIGSGERRRSIKPEVRRTTNILDYERGDALLLIGYR